MIAKKFINKKHFISTLLYDKIYNEIFDIQLKQTQPSMFSIRFTDKNNTAEVTEGSLTIHLTADYKITYAHLELHDKLFIFKEEAEILPLPILIIDAEDFYNTMSHLVSISDMSADYMLTWRLT